MRFGQLLRYSSNRDAAQQAVDGLPNYYHETVLGGSPLPLLERGINPIGQIKLPMG